MSLYLVAGQNAATDPADSLTHLPTRRPRRYPSDTSDAEWEILAPYVPAGGPAPGRGGRPVTLPLPKTPSALVRAGVGCRRCWPGCWARGLGVAGDRCGMMVRRAAATCVPGCDERVRGVAPAADEQ
jgi:hypothetical protein